MQWNLVDEPRKGMKLTVNNPYTDVYHPPEAAGHGGKVKPGHQRYSIEFGNGNGTSERADLTATIYAHSGTEAAQFAMKKMNRTDIHSVAIFEGMKWLVYTKYVLQLLTISAQKGPEDDN